MVGHVVPTRVRVGDGGAVDMSVTRDTIVEEPEEGDRVPAMTTRLVSAPIPPAEPRTWPERVQSLIDRPGGAASPGFHPLRVHGGPGTGKTSLIVDVAVARLADPAIDPESVSYTHLTLPTICSV